MSRNLIFEVNEVRNSSVLCQLFQYFQRIVLIWKKKKNSHVIKIYTLLGLKYAAHLSWMLISVKRKERLSDFCLTFVVDIFVLLLLLPCRWLCLYGWRVIENKKRYNWKRVQYIDTSIWIGFGVQADMFCTTSPDINSWNFQRSSFDFLTVGSNPT